MHIKILAFAVAAFAAAPVFAADAMVDDLGSQPQVAQSAFDWSGFYLGFQGGYTWTHINYLSDSKQDLNGGSTGIHAGYNFQNGPIVYGIENDINYNWKDSDRVSLQWDGSARGRVGYALDRTLFYGTAGMAAANGDVNISGVGKKSDVLLGWTAGGGVEHAVADNITVRAEYRYDDFGSVNFGRALGDFKIDQQKVILGASLKF